MYTVVALAAYAAVALLVTLRALAAILRPGRLRRRLDGVDRTVLVVVALVTGAAWLLLLPFYAHGWVRTRRVRALEARAGARRGGALHLPARPRLRGKSVTQTS